MSDDNHTREELEEELQKAERRLNWAKQRHETEAMQNNNVPIDDSVLRRPFRANGAELEFYQYALQRWHTLPADVVPETGSAVPLHDGDFQQGTNLGTYSPRRTSLQAGRETGQACWSLPVGLHRKSSRHAKPTSYVWRDVCTSHSRRIHRREGRRSIS
jgi:hypothetical protein